MDLAKYKTLFVSESREYLQGMSDRILKLSDVPSKEGFDWLFRAAHSIKGMSASLGYGPLTTLSHRMENVFETLRKGDMPFNQNIQTVLLHGLDLIESMLNELDRGDPIRTSTNTFEAALQKSKAGASERTEATRFLYKLEWTMNPQTVLSSMVADSLLRRMEELGRISGLSPSREELKSGNAKSPIVCYLVTTQPAAQLEEALRKFPELLHASVSPVDPFTRRSPEAEAITFFESADESFRFNTVRVDTAKVDRLIEDVGELLIKHTQLEETHPEDAEFSHLKALAQQIYDGARDLRMLPFEIISRRFPRIVHDLGKKLGKKVQLKIEGAEIEMDKAILVEIADPLIHLLRNAMDHGIEPPAVRASTGKSETGSILISIAKKGNRLIIAVEDDGRGLDPQIIKKTAIENRLIAPGIAELLNPQETLLLIMRPGFSTASNVSEVSGRGVGLDAVRARIDSLGGEFLIFSRPGKYTRFELVLPFTLAVIPVLMVRLHNMRLAVPLTRVRRVVLLNRKDVHHTSERAVLYEEDRAISVESLERCVFRSQETFAEEFPAFVTEHQNREIAWVVDELIEEKEILLKLLGQPLCGLGIYSGATILSNGEVVPVLDMEQLYRERYE